jgi:Mg2+/Co2+ transporter CorB
LVIVLLLALSAFFSSCETAISVSSKAKLHHLVKSGSKKAILAESLKDQIGYVINSVLACNTVLNAVATSLAAGLFASLFETWGVACASLVMACLILLYAEVLPKMIAIQRPERLITKFAYVIKFFLIVCKPIARVTNWIARETLTLLRFNQLVTDAPSTSVDELRGVIDLHRGADQDSIQERAMLKSILDLRSVQVSEIMVHRKIVTMLNANDSIDSIVDQILNSPFSRIPLWEGNTDNIIGIVNVKILLRKVRSMPNKLEEINIREIANNPWFIPDSTDLLEQLQMFRKRREHFALVVDEYGAFLGIVTLEDILEEIVGEIDDEHDICVKGVRKQPDNSVIIDGSVTIRDLNREFDWNLPDDVAATIAGLLINTARMIPSVGQVFMLYGFRLTVLKRQRNQITLVKISKCEDVAADRDEGVMGD